MRRTKAVQGVAVAAAPFFALVRPSSLHALTRSLQAFSTLAAAFAASLAGSTFGGAFGIAHTHARRLVGLCPTRLPLRKLRQDACGVQVR